MITESIDLTRDNIWFWFIATPNNKRILRELTRKIIGEARCPHFNTYVRVGWCEEMGDSYGINGHPYDGWNLENKTTWETFCGLFYDKPKTPKISHSPFFIRIRSASDLTYLLRVIELLGYSKEQQDRVRNKFYDRISKEQGGLCVRVGICKGCENDIWWTGVTDNYYESFKQLTEVFIKGEDHE